MVTMCKMLGEYRMHSEQNGEGKFSSPCVVSNCLSNNLVMVLSVQVIKKKKKEVMCGGSKPNTKFKNVASWSGTDISYFRETGHCSTHLTYMRETVKL